MSVNALLPQMIGRVCLMTKTPWGHLSSGSIYAGSKIIEDGQERIETNFATTGNPAALCRASRAIPRVQRKGRIHPFFSSSALQFLQRDKGACRRGHSGNEPEPLLHLAFAACLSANGMSRAICSASGRNPWMIAINSLSHLEDCVKACLDLWEKNSAPFGIYNVTNPGVVAVREILARHPARRADARNREVNAPAAFPVKTPRSNCILGCFQTVATRRQDSIGAGGAGGIPWLDWRRFFRRANPDGSTISSFEPIP